LGTPFPDTPDKGVLIVNSELSPIAGPSIESGPPTKESIEIARVIDRGIRESQIVNVNELCVVPGKLVWLVFVDIYFLSEHGNWFDAGSIAAVAALNSTKIPVIEVNDEDKVTYTGDTQSLPMTGLSTSMTFVKTGNFILMDPLLIEERIAESRFTCAFREDGTLTAAL
ncbi:MAG: exosome complex protein Rrp42, partial [Candidatus Hodarchaeales archaeon]